MTDLEALLTRSLTGERRPTVVTETTTHNRRLYIGSADVAAILSMYHPDIDGLTRYVTAGDVFNRIVLGLGQPANPKMNRGIRVEPAIRQLYRDTVGPCAEPPGVIVHPAASWACGSPDGLVADDGVFEAKSVIVWSRHLWGQGGDSVPPHINLQCQWLMECTGRKWTHLLAAFGEDSKDSDEFLIRESVVYEMEHDAELCGELFRCAERFWREHCAVGVPPGVEPRHNKAAFGEYKNGRVKDGSGNREVSEVEEDRAEVPGVKTL